GVLGVADAHEGGVEQADGDGEDFAQGELLKAQVAVDGLADAWEGAAEGDGAMVAGLVAGGLPLGVVAILLAAAGVAAGGLHVAVGVGADPDAGPGGWDGEGADAGKG